MQSVSACSYKNMREIITIYGRKFDLEVVFECHENEEITEKQKETLDAFIENAPRIEESLQHVKDYLLRISPKELPDGFVDNVFRYMYPRRLLILHDWDGAAAILCSCALDPEHGLAIVFKDNVCRKVGPEYIVHCSNRKHAADTC